MIAFAPFVIPVYTPKGSGIVVYVESNPIWENDCVTVALHDGGQWLHFDATEIKAWNNSTYGIKKQEDK
jgi:hypothetical protein